MIGPLALFAFIAPLLATAAPVAQPAKRTPAPVQFTGHFPSNITCGTGDNDYGVGYLTGWTGGSGHYDFGVILNYPNLPDTHPGTVLRNSTLHSYIWNSGACESYPAGSTITFFVNDAEYTTGDEQYYADSKAIPVLTPEEAYGSE